MNYDTIPSLPRLFFDQAQKLGAKPFLWRKEDGAFTADPLESRSPPTCGRWRAA